MKKTFLAGLATGVMMLFGGGEQALATPTLQLDILGGSYDTASETIISNGDIFTLYAYLIEDSSNLVTDTYFISAALTPAVAETAGGDYGSFSFDGTPYGVTSDMIYGKPPADDAYPPLGPHGIFDTYYKEFLFTFNSADQASQTNSQDHPGAPLQTGTGMYYAAFSIDTSSILPGYEIHFDLYNENVRRDKEITQFAPYSHDAESSGAAPVPEPATILLMGTGLAGLIGVRRKKKA